MNNRILTIIFSTLAAMFTELNALILSGCERDPDMDDIPAPVGPAQDAAAILAGAPAIQPGPTADTVTVNKAMQPGQTETAAPPIEPGPGSPLPGVDTLPPGPVPGTVVAGPGTVVAGPGAAPGVTVDVEGIPWDKRIHSSGKTFYKSKAANGAPKGAWKLKKGVDAVTVAQIKTELAGGAPAGTAAPAVIPATTPATTAPGETTEVCTDIYTWASLVEKATAAGITPEVMAAACQKFNVPGIIELQDQALLIPVVGKELGL